MDLGGIEPVIIHGRRSDLSRLARNLVDNAARHATDRIALSCSQTNDGAVLVICDDGPGIATADRGRIFERFTRLDEGRARDNGGSGLGLAIAAQIAADHQATIDVDDAPGGGARFTVRFSVTGR